MGGSNNKKPSSNVNKDQTHILELLSTMNWREKIFKIFCFKFEYKYYKKDTQVRFNMGWAEFDKKMLNNFEDLENNRDHLFIHDTFENYFKLQPNKEIRVFKIYMLYFPYVLHLKGMTGLNFIDFIYEKVIYNIEVEINQNIINAEKNKKESEDSGMLLEYDKMNLNLEIENENEKGKDLKSNKSRTNTESQFGKGILKIEESTPGILSNSGVNILGSLVKRGSHTATKSMEKSESDKINSEKGNNENNLNNNNNNENNENNLNNNNNNENNENNLNNNNNNNNNENNDDKIDRRRSRRSFFSNAPSSSNDSNLMKMYEEYMEEKASQKTFVRTLPLKIFREIMFVYFMNNIRDIILAFKQILLDFQENLYENEDFIKKVKEIKPDNINTDKLTAENAYKFIDETIHRLAKKRINLPKFKDLTTLELTFDDIYLYIKLNSFFLNSYECYLEFNRTID